MGEPNGRIYWADESGDSCGRRFGLRPDASDGVDSVDGAVEPNDVGYVCLFGGGNQVCLGGIDPVDLQ